MYNTYILMYLSTFKDASVFSSFRGPLNNSVVYMMLSLSVIDALQK